MQDIGIGDVIFILLILGVIHGIMYWVAGSKRPNKSNEVKAPDREN